MATTTQKFADAYKVLKDTADKLQKQNEPDIDSLVTDVANAMKAYRVCKERIDAARAQLKEQFGEEFAQGEEVGAGAGGEEGRTERGPNDDPEVPF